MTLVIDSQYFAPINCINELSTVSHCKIEQYEIFRKMSFRNRCYLAGANGIICLSIPVEGGRTHKGIMKDTKISNSDKWQLQHWKTITSCYNRSPWFEFYRDELESMYRKQVSFLLDWNLECINWVFPKLELSLEMSLTQEYVKTYEQGIFVDLRNHYLPKSIHSIKEDQVKYTQVFEDRLGFIPNLSILDLLFCEGKNAGKRLKGKVIGKR